MKNKSLVTRVITPLVLTATVMGFAGCATSSQRNLNELANTQEAVREWKKTDTGYCAMAGIHNIANFGGSPKADMK